MACSKAFLQSECCHYSSYRCVSVLYAMQMCVYTQEMEYKDPTEVNVISSSTFHINSIMGIISAIRNFDFLLIVNNDGPFD